MATPAAGRRLQALRCRGVRTESGPPTTIVGIGADGWPGLSESARAAIASADALFGGHRHLELIGDVRAVKVEWPSPLLAGLDELFATYSGARICVLASGDPLLSGIGGTLIRRYGGANLRIIPGVSSVALARARLGWTAEETEVLSAVGRDLTPLRRMLTPGRRILVLSAAEHTPAAVARHLGTAGYGDSALTVLEELGGSGERRIDSTANTLLGTEVARLNVLAIECVADPDTTGMPTTPGLPDDVFDHDGALTKRTVRAATLAALAPLPGELLWDVGAGSGSVAVEWCRVHPANRAIAVERDQARCARIETNAERLGAADLRVVAGSAPEVLSGLDTPDAVFVGGGLRHGVLETCWNALPVGGRLAANGVSVQAERYLAEAYAAYGGEMSRVSVQHAEPLGGLTGWNPTRTVTQWHARKTKG